nr:PREDICTED: CLK4-associating serine/arginine rich protein-like [Bemisia tabaci]
MGSLSLLVATIFLIEVHAGIPVMTRVMNDENKASVQNQIAVPQDEWTKLEVGSEATTAPDKASAASQHLAAREPEVTPGVGPEAGAAPTPALAKTVSRRKSWGNKLNSFRLTKSRSKSSRSDSPSRSDTSSRAGSPARSDSSLSRARSSAGSESGYTSDGSNGRARLQRSHAFREGGSSSSLGRSKRYNSFHLDGVMSPTREGQRRSPPRRRNSSKSQSG